MVTAIAEPLAVSVDEAARRLSVGRTLLYDLIRQGKVRAVKLGTRTIIPATEISRLLDTPDDGNRAA
jgi:excisionase family DNA binding protein